MAINTVGVVGLGLMGRGITASLLIHGFRAIVYTQGAPDSHERARTYVQNAIEEIAAKANLQRDLSEWPNRYIEASSLLDFSSCDFVIESATEDLLMKRQIFDELESVVRKDVPIASNTSALPIGLLQTGRKYSTRFIGMHWAEPAYLTRFLEVIRGEHTSNAAVELAAELARRTDKDPCFVQKDVPGFIANRLGYALYREALYLLQSGVGDVETIDRAFRNAFGLWATLCGPFRWMDVTGGPALYAKAMEPVIPTLATSPEIPQTLIDMRQDGYQGTKDGHGFYQYRPGDAEHWEKLVREHAWRVRQLQDQYYPLPPDGR